MSAEPDTEKDEERLKAERQANSMKDQLSKEVASWSKERKHHSSETPIAPSPAVIKQRTPRLRDQSHKPSVPPPADKVAGASTKPFSMSYDGMTTAEYTQYRRDRGSR